MFGKHLSAKNQLTSLHYKAELSGIKCLVIPDIRNWKSERRLLMKASPDQDILSDMQWEQVKGKVKEWWNKLTDADLNRIHGHNNLLIDVIAERYGYTKE